MSVKCPVCFNLQDPHCRRVGCPSAMMADLAKAPEFGMREVPTIQPRSSVNEIQVGGKHYRSEYQHWDLVINLKLHYLIGCASKYVTRRKDPNKRIEDLNKAVHYIDKSDEAGIIALQEPMPIAVVKDHVIRFALANQLTMREAVALECMIMSHYSNAKDTIRDLIAETK